MTSPDSHLPSDLRSYLQSLPPRPFLTRLEAGDLLTPEQETHALSIWQWIVSCQQNHGGVSISVVKKLALAHGFSRIALASALLIARKKIHCTPMNGWKPSGSTTRTPGKLGYGVHTDAWLQAWRERVDAVDPFEGLG